MRVLKSIFHLPSMEFKKTFCCLTEKIKLLATKIFRVFSKSDPDNNSVKVNNNVTKLSSSQSSSFSVSTTPGVISNQEISLGHESSSKDKKQLLRSKNNPDQTEEKNCTDYQKKVSTDPVQTSALRTFELTFYKHGNLNNNVYVKRFLESSKYPTKFINLLRNFLIFRKTSIKRANLTTPTIKGLSYKILGEIAKFYSNKYHINMSTCLDSNLSSVLKGWQSENEFTPRGVIVLNHKEEGHVTPIIVNKTSGKMEVLTLDVLGKVSEYMPTCFETIKACKDLDIDCWFAAINRQATPLGCGTGAVVVLRNALIDLSQKNQSILTLQDVLGQPLNSENICNHSVKLICNLPVTWTYCDQIFPKNADQSITIPRNIFSNKACKAKTVGDFRRANTQSCTYENTLTLSRDNDYENFIEDFITKNMDKLNQSYPLEIKIDSENVYIRWNEIREHNTYILEKGSKFAKKFDPSNSKQDLDI